MHGPEADGKTTPIKVVYILGWGRSGTTVLDTALGSMSGFFSGGEFHSIFDSGFRRRIPCGCGAAVSECPIWSAVLADALGPPNLWSEKIERLLWLERAYLRERHVLPLVFRLPKGRPSRDLRAYIEVLGSIYASLGRETESRVIVDSSKTPTYAALLPWMHGVTPYFVHLVRDPRAAAHSWAQPRTQPGLEGPAQMTRMTAFRSTLRWDARNLLIELLCRRSGVPSMRITYEEFATEPLDALKRIIGLLGEKAEPPIEGDDTLILSPNHSIGGNPVRFLSGRIQLKLDRRWMHAQRVQDRVVSTIAAMPLLHRYGYPMRS